MHKLMEYVCDELDELERKADKDGKLSMAEVQYADMLTNMKKNMLKMDSMNGYSTAYDYGRRRDAMGRYSRRYSMAGEDMIERLRDMMEDAPDDMTRKEFEKFIRKVEQM